MDISKIESRVKKNTKKCWLWQGAVSSSGYGQLEEDGKTWTAHAYSYTCHNGKIPDDKQVRHKCGNKLCCNPNHLELGTARDNYNDSKEAHTKADSKRRSKTGWIVDGVKYHTAAEAVNKTGISMNSINKFTYRGKFNRERYEKACKLAGHYPVKPIKKTT